MDLQSTPFPGKSRPSNLKTNRKALEENRTSSKKVPIHRQKRVFGTARSTNVLVKKVVEKPLSKTPVGVSRKQTKPSRDTPSKPSNKQVPKLAKLKVVAANAVTAGPATEAVEKKSSDKIRTRSKKSVCFQEPLVGSIAKTVQEDDTGEARTPMPSSSLSKPRMSGTPYHSAENCSKCRLNRLETSSYWISQIKLAEPVGKHFVSASFFRLAFKSNAEPIRSLRVELKRYLARHESLSTEIEWRDVLLTYGLLKDEGDPGGVLALEKADTSETVLSQVLKLKDGSESLDKVEAVEDNQNQGTEAFDEAKIM